MSAESSKLTEDRYQDFFNFMNQEHGLILTTCEMNDILEEADKLLKAIESQ
tara:strand:+ start:499 stop:651 length:153 start_codon:yes stop_codon:yes gene_type:complete